MREALEAVPEYGSDGTGERDPDGFRRQLARRGSYSALKVIS